MRDDAGQGPEVQVMMKQQQEQLRREYEGKLADLERERETIGWRHDLISLIIVREVYKC